ncbi:MAG TPA: hypothetical protein VGV38_21625 [Pyrinomonadaceae bacterium]|nr:hypothetical protein [Pyrinomonadaceae bacterium]
MTTKPENTYDELARRHRAALLTVALMMVVTLVLAGLALSGRFSARLLTPDPTTVWTLRIVMVFLAVGAVPLRRTRFNAARLQDIASLRGTSGLLATLHGTTRLLALLGGAIAVVGFVVCTMTYDLWDVVRLVVFSFAVLFYAYPRLPAWRRVVEATQGGGPPAGASPAKGTIA